MLAVPQIRHIDWKRGTPYIFREEDFYELKNTPALFARKYDINVDRNIVGRIYKEIYSMKGNIL